jgi:hypothetical protein
LADAARTMLRTCKFEIGEIHLCRDCYKRSNEPEGPDWFCIPCKPQHELVVAKAKGFPFWPAKVLQFYIFAIDCDFSAILLHNIFDFLGSQRNKR